VNNVNVNFFLLHLVNIASVRFMHYILWTLLCTHGTCWLVHRPCWTSRL